MPDVFSAAWANAYANVRPAGISSAMAKVTLPTPDSAYNHLGANGDAKVTLNPLQVSDAFLRQRGFGYELEAVITSLQASAVECKLIPVFMANQMSLRLASMDTLGISRTSGLGCKIKLECNGDGKDLRKLIYTFKGLIKQSEGDALFTTSLPAVGTVNPADALYTLAQAEVIGDQVSNGISAIQFKASSDSSYVSIGSFQNAKYSFETIGEDNTGGLGIFRATALKFLFDVESLESTDMILNYLDSIQAYDIDLKITHNDGSILTMLGTNFSTLMSPDWSGKLDKFRTTKFHAEGALPFNGTTFVETGGTAWASMWS